jgi:hypothetical protein
LDFTAFGNSYGDRGGRNRSTLLPVFAGQIEILIGKGAEAWHDPAFFSYYAPYKKMFLLDFGSAVLAGGRTTLVIAHRLATIKNADRIVVVTERGITEQGRHQEMVAAGGFP